MYLEISGGFIDLYPEHYPDEEDVALEVIELLYAGEDWVQLGSYSESGWATQWTVMTRDEAGNPLKIVSEEFDGTTEVLIFEGE
jgi:hypothetical protein